MNSLEQTWHAHERHRVHVVDDDEGFRTGITRLLNASGLNAIPYDSADDYMRASHCDLPGCVLLDLTMPGKSGMEIFTELATREHVPPVIFLTGSGDIPTGVQAIRYGAVDFITKPVTMDQLLESINKAISVGNDQRKKQARLVLIRKRYESLNERERQVFQGDVEGRLSKQLAASIGICERTVKTLRAQVWVKMQTRELRQLVEAAFLLGLV